MAKEKKEKGAVKKAFYKKWWFWVIIIVVLAGIFGSGGKDKDAVQTASENESSATETSGDSKQTDSESEGIDFVVSDVRNDVTGKWRKSLIAENVEPKDYALDYYKQYFKSDDEIHAIINFNYNTTTKLSVMDNLLDVTIYEYVDKEEHDAKVLFSGMVLDEYFIDIDSGEILNAQETTSTKEVSPDNFIADVKDVIQGAISSKVEAITDVVLENGDLCVYVDFSKADPSPLTLEDLALSRTSSITDAILELKDYDELWETITIDFGDVGHITNSKVDMQNNSVGRYFPAEDFKIE
ncbi:MAG: hypothetical protein OSJ73_15540 [Lachnospiraceae bacterium]|nr:hypothetical protein [Lachnospiraceae bacterium]